jgi:hypothetical protein
MSSCPDFRDPPNDGDADAGAQTAAMATRRPKASQSRELRIYDNDIGKGEVFKNLGPAKLHKKIGAR